MTTQEAQTEINIAVLKLLHWKQGAYLNLEEERLADAWESYIDAIRANKEKLDPKLKKAYLDCREEAERWEKEDAERAKRDRDDSEGTRKLYW